VDDDVGAAAEVKPLCCRIVEETLLGRVHCDTFNIRLSVLVGSVSVQNKKVDQV
jgi:hypothetical protein